MRNWKRFALAAAFALIPAAAPAANLSVMSFNVHGLPWPIVHHRSRPLGEIGAALAGMRAQGVQPHVVLLQEAFTASARRIQAEAGYPYSALGPGAHHDLESSGLMVLSDYPIVDRQTMVYSRGACAGFDCLSNKGVLLVRVQVPGAVTPVTLVDTHMNARGASHVRRTIADSAYGNQSEELRAFLRDELAPDAPAIVAGDLNVGQIPYRQAMITGGGGLLDGGADAVRTALAGGARIDDADAARTIADHNKDWMFARGGTGAALTLTGVRVPFARGTLSDHAGYIADYELVSGVPSQVATRVGVPGQVPRP